MTDIIGYYGKREGNGPLAEKLVGHRDTTNSSEQTAKLQQHTEAAINSMHVADLKAGKLQLTLEDFEAHGDPSCLSTSRKRCRTNRTWRRKTHEPSLFLSSSLENIDDKTGAADEMGLQLTGVFGCPLAPPPLPNLEPYESRKSMEVTCLGSTQPS